MVMRMLHIEMGDRKSNCRSNVLDEAPWLQSLEFSVEKEKVDTDYKNCLEDHQVKEGEREKTLSPIVF